MSLVFDVAWDRPTPQQLKAAGAIAVCRYLSYDTTGKNLTRSEAQSYADVGIAVVSNWEYAARAASLGHAQGTKDAFVAIQQHRDYGGPSNKPIAYSVDFDTPDYAPSLPNTSDNARAKLGPIAGYFDAIRDAHDGQPVGAYGGYWVIKRLFDAGLIAYGWQTYGWSGNPPMWDSRAQLRQVENATYLSGHDVDRDDSEAPDFGQWFPVGYTPSPPPAPVPPHPGTHTPGTRELLLATPHMTGPDVLFVQRFIGPRMCGVADSDFGPHTQGGVQWYQHMRGITADGIVGPVTWRNMGVSWAG